MTSPTGQSSGPFDRFDDVRPYPIWPGALARAVSGERMGLALVELDSNTEVAEHTHPNEQVGFVLQGIFSFTIAGETRELHPGETYVIPASVPHSGRAGPEGAVVIDVFSPPRTIGNGSREGSRPKPPGLKRSPKLDGRGRLAFTYPAP